MNYTESNSTSSTTVYLTREQSPDDMVNDVRITLQSENFALQTTPHLLKMIDMWKSAKNTNEK